jgi:hypothetical protein
MQPRSEAKSFSIGPSQGRNEYFARKDVSSRGSNPMTTAAQTQQDGYVRWLEICWTYFTLCLQNFSPRHQEGENCSGTRSLNRVLCVP